MKSQIWRTRVRGVVILDLNDPEMGGKGGGRVPDERPHLDRLLQDLLEQDPRPVVIINPQVSAWSSWVIRDLMAIKQVVMNRMRQEQLLIVGLNSDGERALNRRLPGRFVSFPRVETALADASSRLVLKS